MEREILFRGKSTVNGDWVFGCYIQRGSFHYILFDRMEIPVHPPSVGQYTGNKSIDGNKIFEGDALGHLGNFVEFSFNTWNINGDRPLISFLRCPILGNKFDLLKP